MLQMAYFVLQYGKFSRSFSPSSFGFDQTNLLRRDLKNLIIFGHDLMFCKFRKWHIKVNSIHFSNFWFKNFGFITPFN